ncbi:MAG: VTT domain-containing protein [Promethearchaeia archaeon]
MAVSKSLTIVFTFIYAAVIIYLMLFFIDQDFQNQIISSRHNISNITAGSNYYWALLISFGICFLGSASIGFPVPFPFVLFSLSNSVYLRYLKQGLTLNEILISGPFWLEILGLAIVGGLGCALGELSGYAIGYGAKAITEETNSDLLKNIEGFSKIIFENEKKVPLYVFIFALTPLPDDILFLPLGMMKYPIWKCIIPGWLGKNFTTIFYCSWPILIALGFLATGAQMNDFSSIVTEAIMLLATITIMLFIMAFNWNKYLENRERKRKQQISENKD